MTKGQRAGDAPIGVNVLEGKSYYWCTCGKSSKQPFCDASHKGTEFNPVVYKAEKNKKMFLGFSGKSPKNKRCPKPVRFGLGSMILGIYRVQNHRET